MTNVMNTDTDEWTVVYKIYKQTDRQTDLQTLTFLYTLLLIKTVLSKDNVYFERFEF